MSLNFFENKVRNLKECTDSFLFYSFGDMKSTLKAV
jgi:hypothetical protein